MKAKELLESKDIKSDIERFRKTYIGDTGDPEFHQVSQYIACTALFREYIDRKDATLNANYTEVLVSGIFPYSFVLGICKMICTCSFAKSIIVDPRIMELICN